MNYYLPEVTWWLLYFGFIVLTYYMSNPSCRPPVCSFNCCNQYGICPSSQSECEHSNFKNPIWVYIVIGIIILFIIIIAIVVLTIFKKRRQKREPMPTVEVSPPSAKQVSADIQIQMKEEEQPKITVNKKNIYVYEREVRQLDLYKDNRTISSSGSTKKSFRSNKSQAQENPFEKRSKIRNRLL